MQTDGISCKSSRLNWTLLRISVDTDKLIDELPFTFSYLYIRCTSSSVGKCWMFHLHNKGICAGYLFPGGYRVFVTKEDSQNKGLFS